MSRISFERWFREKLDAYVIDPFSVTGSKLEFRFSKGALIYYDAWKGEEVILFIAGDCGRGVRVFYTLSDNYYRSLSRVLPRSKYSRLSLVSKLVFNEFSGPYHLKFIPFTDTSLLNDLPNSLYGVYRCELNWKWWRYCRIFEPQDLHGPFPDGHIPLMEAVYAFLTTGTRDPTYDAKFAIQEMRRYHYLFKDAVDRDAQAENLIRRLFDLDYDPRDFADIEDEEILEYRPLLIIYWLAILKLLDHPDYNCLPLRYLANKFREFWCLPSNRKNWASPGVPFERIANNIFRLLFNEREPTTYPRHLLKPIVDTAKYIRQYDQSNNTTVKFLQGTVGLAIYESDRYELITQLFRWPISFDIDISQLSRNLRKSEEQINVEELARQGIRHDEKLYCGDFYPQPDLSFRPHRWKSYVQYFLGDFEPPCFEVFLPLSSLWRFPVFRLAENIYIMPADCCFTQTYKHDFYWRNLPVVRLSLRDWRILCYFRGALFSFVGLNDISFIKKNSTLRLKVEHTLLPEDFTASPKELLRCDAPSTLAELYFSPNDSITAQVSSVASTNVSSYEITLPRFTNQPRRSGRLLLYQLHVIDNSDLFCVLGGDNKWYLMRIVRPGIKKLFSK